MSSPGRTFCRYAKHAYAWRGLATTVLLLLLTCMPVRAAERELTFAGSTMWGRWHDLAVHEEYVYAGSSNGIRIIDVRNPEAPGVVGSAYLQADAYSVAIRDSLLYCGLRLGWDNHRLGVLDISDPTEPRQLISIPLQFGDAKDMKLIDTTLFVATQHGLVIMNVSGGLPEFISLYE
ncbi:hypothetical protein GF377_08580, partial [candidate division GN15 bacterium]|nr:hypothetical protein [candidate division GN15 bacterium]